MFQLTALFLTYQYVLVVLTVRQIFFPVQVYHPEPLVQFHQETLNKSTMLEVWRW